MAKAKGKLGSGKRFAALVQSIKARGGKQEEAGMPMGMMNAKGGKKQGASKMGKWAAKAKKKT